MRHGKKWFLFAAGLFLASGCSSTSHFETRSYTLRDVDAEKVLIQRVIEDEMARLGDRAFPLLRRRGGRLEALSTSDHVAIVTITPRGHSAIHTALNQARQSDL